ncbi:MAG TPA: TetR/AcrR family transcriptional regulator [Chitinophagales bacterium]|nr:TetR/AcrR family transcriptional regulator [Chitinophagales bacterium]
MNKPLRIQKIELLLMAAAKVFYVQGFHGAKMSHVAKEASVSKGVLYFYFQNKEDLYMALVHYCILKVDEYKEQLLSSVADQNGKDQVLVFLHFYFRMIEEQPEIQNPIVEYIRMSHPSRQEGFETGLTKGMRESDYFKQILSIQFKTTTSLVQLIEKGQQDKSIQNLSNAKLIYATIWSMMLGYEQLSVAEKYFQEVTSDQMPLFHIDRRDWQMTMIESIKNILNQKI